MNLIEQLGGYCYARRMSQDWKSSIDGDIPLDTMMYSYDFGIFSWGDLQYALLEYRRQLNIFEESDKIVFVDDFMHGELMVVAWTREGEVWMDEGAKRCTDLSMIRHATDAEIHAGKRL